MSLSEIEKKELGRTLEIYRKIAIVINSFPKGKTVSVKDLAKKANVHWNTARKALLFLRKIAPLIPEFELHSNLQFRVQEKPYALKAVEGIFESKEMRILTKMMLAEATELEKAEKLKDILSTDEKSALPDLIEKGYINSINGNYYLSKRGQSLGSMGIRKIVDLNIPLPWEQPGLNVQKVGVRPSRLPMRGRYRLPLPNAPKTIYPPEILNQERSKWKGYVT